MKNDERVEDRELQVYEAPEMFEVGSFQEDTGYIGRKKTEPIAQIPRSFW
ncbi:keywimysin-related RiPP [Streptomyces sp. MST-110588]|nr:keywimysin-related RiPP [Streptomyces sp. MST-110588]UNO38686.1 lasso RiPP family leader peptide-containing protein [Streptomyces sp. MST-110588]